jgi:hypothetical protein
MGCGSKVPIADVAKAVPDDRLIGAWTSLDNEQDDLIELNVYKFNDREYLAWIQSEEKDTLKVSVKHDFYRFYVIKIKEKNFINAQFIEPKNMNNREFYFYNYRVFNDSLLVLKDLQDIDSTQVNKFEKSEELYNFIKSNINNEALYGEPLKLLKIKDPQ